MKKQTFQAICIVSTAQGQGSIIARFDSIEDRDKWKQELELKPENTVYACSARVAKLWPYNSGFPVKEYDYRAQRKKG